MNYFLPRELVECEKLTVLKEKLNNNLTGVNFMEDI